MSTWLLKNVRPLDVPEFDGSRTVDLLVSDGAVARIGQNLKADNAATRDFAGAYLSPAWIDVHSHVYWGGSDIALKPSVIGASTGVPILVDAGSAGEGNFLGFDEFIIKSAHERIIPFLNVGSIGLVATNRVPEVRRLQDIDIERVMATVNRYRGLIAGLKMRLCSIIESETDILPLKLAKKLSRCLKLPLMTHIGRPLPLVEEVFEYMDKGDIVTHCFQGKPASSVIDDDVVFAAMLAARERGVILDVGHGAASFSYRVARQCLERGIKPDVIGSDLHNGSLDGPVWDLSLVLSKLHSLGMTLAETIAGCASSARSVLNLPPADLKVGSVAEFTLFTTEESALDLPDSNGEVARINRRICPRAVLWKGELADAASRMPYSQCDKGSAR